MADDRDYNRRLIEEFRATSDAEPQSRTEGQ